MTPSDRPNIALAFETALISAWEAEGLSSNDVFFDGFQITKFEGKESEDKRFSQIQFGVGSDVPDGNNSIMYISSGFAQACTYLPDDPKRKDIRAVYKAMRNAFSTANKDPDAFEAFFPAVPDGWVFHFDTVTIISGDIPFLDDRVSVIAVTFEFRSCLEDNR